VSGAWQESVLQGAENGRLPEGYQRHGAILARAELLASSDQSVWSTSDFFARSKVPHTTSAVEAEIRRRHLKRLFTTYEIDAERPVLDLGCADGLLAHDLLQIGCEKLVSTDILPHLVETLDRSLAAEQRERVLLVVDDMMRLPLRQSSFTAVFAWGILSVAGAFDRALDLAWSWVAPGGYLLLAEPLLEQALVYPLIRGDPDEFRRVQAERTRAGMWEERDDRYRVNTVRFYTDRLKRLPAAKVAESGGISMLPSLLLGGLFQEKPVGDDKRAEFSELLKGPELDELALWRQAFWLVQKA
jgi:SAM-dependent methyltransferase